MRPKEKLYELAVPDRTGLPGDLDGFGMAGVS